MNCAAPTLRDERLVSMQSGVEVAKAEETAVSSQEAIR